MRTITGLSALLFLFPLMGCPQPTETGTDPNDTDDTDINAEMALVTVNVLIEGAVVDCATHFDEEFVGPSSTEVEVEPGSYTLTVGEYTDTSDDGLPLHPDGIGGLWIAPEQEISLAAGENPEISVPLNRYIRGEWTCAQRGDEDQIGTMVIEYTNGYTLTLPYLSDLEVTGNTVSWSEDGLELTGEFLSSTTLYAVVTNTSTSGTREYDCWAGDEDDRS